MVFCEYGKNEKKKYRMSRLKADLLMLLAALIWGIAFVAQKSASEHLGAFTFVAARFLLSAIVILPFAWREYQKKEIKRDAILNRDVFLLCIAFSAALVFQQAGIAHTSVTNAGFFTGVYVLFVPLFCRWMFGQDVSVWIWPGATLSVIGVWFLSGGNLVSAAQLNNGDILVLLCAVSFGLQVALIGKLATRTRAPLVLSFIQYIFIGCVCLVLSLSLETITIAGLEKAMVAILYAGLLSGGIAFTLQVVAQQYAPASDSAVILSSEAVFAAIAAAIVMGERLTPFGITGCALITVAILLVELGPYLIRPKK